MKEQRFIILYDLRKKNKENYPDLYQWFDENKAIGINESVYLVKSSKTLDEVYAELDKLTNKDDDLVVNVFPKPAMAKNSNKYKWFNK